MLEPNLTARAGQSVKCRVVAPEPGGYRVRLVDLEVDGFLPCQEELNEGQLVPASFVCMTGGRALMTFAYRVGTTERVQVGLPSEPETAFAVWADSHPRTFKLRRATDVVLPPLDGHLVFPVKSGDYDILQLYKDLEDGALSGCVKVESDERLSRGAILLYRGRVVGAIYGRKPMTDPYPVEPALKMTLEDSFLPESELTIYNLPEEIVLSMSAMFLGCPVTGEDGVPAREGMKPLLDDLHERKDTGCITLTGADTGELAIVYVKDGSVLGAFQVDRTSFDDKASAVNDLIDEVSGARAELSILPPELTTDAVLFGYGLSATLTEMQDGPARFSDTR